MPIIDKRNLYDDASTTTNWVDGTGAATSFTVDTEVKIEGTSALGTSFTLTSGELGILHDNTLAADRSNTIWYIWFNFLAPGVLQLKSASGVTVRFCGATITDFFEFNVAGTDTYTGGWVQFVVDIEGTPDNTGGTPPATSAIQYAGIVVTALTDMPKMADNYFIDAIWYIDNKTPAIIVDGQNDGSPWTWNDIIATASDGAWGTAKLGPGGSVVLSGGVQFGETGSATHEFSDTNKVILWEDNLLPEEYYQLTVTGSNAGITKFTAGIKIGGGDTAVGISGWVVTAASGSTRFDINLNETGINTGSFYSTVFQHAGKINAPSNIPEFINSQFTDINSITQSRPGTISSETGSLMLSNTFLNPTTAVSSSYLLSYDPTQIRLNSFIADQGHAIEITKSGSFTFVGNEFTNYGINQSGDAALLNNTSGIVTMSIAGGGSTPTFRDGTGASTLILQSVIINLTELQPNTEVRVYASGTQPQPELAGTESIGATTSFEFSLQAGTETWIHLVHLDFIIEDFNFTIPNTDISLPQKQSEDRNYLNP